MPKWIDHLYPDLDGRALMCRFLYAELSRMDSEDGTKPIPTVTLWTEVHGTGETLRVSFPLGDVPDMLKGVEAGIVGPIREELGDENVSVEDVIRAMEG